MKKIKQEAEYKLTVMSPFGPNISLIRLPDLVVNKLLKMTDDIIKDENKISEGSRLFGQIESELKISIGSLQQEGLHDFFNHLFKEYADSNLGNALNSPINSDQVIIQLTGAWVNSQYENEYNPIHWHDGCTLSATLYLKIPKYKKRNIPSKIDTDGSIVFITDNPSSPMLSFEKPTALFSPQVGDMFIWPSRLLHGVYPFQGKGERRSVSINALHRLSL